MRAFGLTSWIISGGHIPFASTGVEPEMLSKDLLSMLNTSDIDAEATITIFFANREPEYNYMLKVGARRIRKIRFNDLIDPKPLLLDEPFSAQIKSSIPIVVQFLKMNTGQNACAIMGTMAYYHD
jgi:hypothetical protein